MIAFSFKHCATFTATMLSLAVNAQTVSQFYSFGDSLSDPGAYAPTTQLGVPGSGRFTTNPGLVWTQYLGQYLGLPSEAAVVNQFGAASRTPNGGTNYAQGGSRVSQTPGIGTAPATPWVTADPVSAQVDRLLANTGGRIDGKALVSVWAGANDIFTQYGAVGGGLSVATASMNVATAANDLTTQISRLKAAGAKLIIVNTVPDIGLTPFGASQGAAGAALLSSMSNVFNQQLLAATAGSNVLVIDANRIVNDLRARPAAYGFTSPTAATVPVCMPPGSSALTCVNPAGAETSIFADGVHPTSAAHKVFAQVTLSTLRAPQQLSSLATNAMYSARQHELSQESQLSGEALLLATGNAEARPVGDVQLRTDVQTVSQDAAGKGLQLSNTSKSNSARVGADIMLAKNWLAGVTLSYAKGDTDFSQNTGGYTSSLTAVSIYSTLALSPEWYVNGALGYGALNFDNINRDSYLGTTNLLVRAQGKTSGKYTSLRAGGGYLLRSGGFSGGPTFDLTRQDLKVNGYTENAAVTSLTFGDINYRTTRASLGFNGNYRLVAVQLFGRISLDQDLNSEPVKVSIVNSPGNAVVVESDRPDRRLVSTTLGVKGALTSALQWRVFANHSKSTSVKGWGLGAGLNMAL